MPIITIHKHYIHFYFIFFMYALKQYLINKVILMRKDLCRRLPITIDEKLSFQLFKH
jgi:hypothetical protein